MIAGLMDLSFPTTTLAGAARCHCRRARVVRKRRAPRLQLEERLRRATVVDEKQLDTETVNVGVRVHVKDQKSGDSKKFQIVGSAEADPTESKLSNESPIGKALVGHKRGDVVTVEVPRGPKRKLKITKIEAA